MAGDSSFSDRLEAATNRLAQSDSVLATVISRVGGCTIRPHSDYFRELVDSIISQQLSIKAAATIVGRFAQLGSGEFPTPDEVVATPHEQIRSLGVSNAKSAALIDLAKHVIEDRLRIHELEELTNEEIIVELTDVKGIGEWTAHMFLIFSLGRLDVLPTGDLGIRKGIMGLYGFDNLPTAPQVTALSERNGWAGAESVASWYVWKSIDS